MVCELYLSEVKKKQSKTVKFNFLLYLTQTINKILL